MLGGVKPFREGGAEIALEEYGDVGGADGLEEGEVLHVSGADLKGVDSGSHGLHVAWRQHFGDEGQAGLGGSVGQDVEAVHALALEAVGRGAGLEGAASEDVGAGGGDGASGVAGQGPGFHGAGASDDDLMIATDGDVAEANDAPLAVGSGTDVGEARVAGRGGGGLGQRLRFAGDGVGHGSS